MVRINVILLHDGQDDLLALVANAKQQTVKQIKPQNVCEAYVPHATASKYMFFSACDFYGFSGVITGVWNCHKI